MKKFLLLSALAVSGLTMMADDTMITIGGDDGANTKCANSGPAPINYYYKNSECQMIWTADQLESAGIVQGTIIKGISFYGANTNDPENKLLNGSIDIYMTETQVSNFGESPFEPLPMPEAASYSVDDYPLLQVGTATEADVMLAMTLDTPYTYQGGNLAMQVNRKSSVWDGSIYFYGYSALKDQTLYRQSDNPYPDITTKTWAKATIFPKVTFTCETAGTSVKTLADNAPAVSVKGGVINADAAAINVYNTNGVNVARANGSLDINNLPAGVYIINVRGDQGVSTMRIVK